MSIFFRRKLAQSTTMAGVALSILGRVPVISSVFSTSGNIQEVMDVKDALTGKAGNEAEKEAKDEIAKWENVKSIETAQKFDMTVTVYGDNVSVKATPKTKEIIDEINKKLEKTKNKEYLSVEGLLHGDDETRGIYIILFKRLIMLKIKQEDVMKKLKNLKMVSIIGIVCISLLIYLLYPVINQEIKKYQTKETFTNLAKDWLNEAKRIEIKKDYKQSMSAMDFTNQLLSEIYPYIEIEIIDKKEENHLYGKECEKSKNKICIFQLENIDEVHLVTSVFRERVVLKNNNNNNNNMYLAFSGPFSDNNVIKNSRFQMNMKMYPDKMELSVEDLATALATYYSEDQGTSELNYIKDKGVYLDKYGNNKYEQEKNDFIIGYVFKHLKIKE